MSDFETDILNAAKEALIKNIRSGASFMIQSRVDISANVQELYNGIDWSRVKDEVIRLMEAEIAQRIVNTYITEFSTDIKKSLSNSVIRKDLQDHMGFAVDKMLKTIREAE